MTSPRSTYGGGYYASSSFPDTPIYDSLVAERGTPQIAPIRVSSPYDGGGSNLPALPALPSGPSGAQSHQAPQPSYGGQGGAPYGYPAPGPQQPSGLQQAAAPYIPQQQPPRAYPAPQPPQQQYQQQRPGAAPAGPAGYDAMRPVAPRPAAAQYEDPYNRQYPNQGGY
ncbi:DUF6643 family protein [Streptomyces roseifaciens]|uniref:DUF6643 family protein n=1 Tax=Streptomyces roseifaciens TaxID=1488406 RepID=UPI000717FD78|nr:DUF6643 family protein [Streptomyces roseifaciens]